MAEGERGEIDKGGKSLVCEERKSGEKMNKVKSVKGREEEEGRIREKGRKVMREREGRR